MARTKAGAKGTLRPNPLAIRKSDSKSTNEHTQGMSQLLREVDPIGHRNDVRNATFHRKIDNAIDLYAGLGKNRRKTCDLFSLLNRVGNVC